MASSQPQSDDDAPPPNWAQWFTIASVVLAVVATSVTIASVGLAGLVSQLRQIGWWFIAIIAFEVATTCADAAALSGFLGHGGRRPGYGYVLRAQFSGRAINAVTPLGSLGEATKATLLMQRTASSRAIAAVVRYNLASFGMIVVAIVIGAPICALLLALPRWLTLVLLIGSLGGAGLLVGGAVLVRRGMLVSFLDALARLRLVPRRRRGEWRAKLEKIDHQLRGRGSQRQNWTPAGWVVLSRVLGWSSMWLVLSVLDGAPSVSTMAALASAGTLISIASTVVPLGLGISEGGNAALFRALGEDALLGVTMVMARRVTSLIYAIGGLTLLATSTTVGQMSRRRQVRAAKARAR